MLQAALSDGLLFDLLPFSQNGSVAAEVDVGRCDVVQALVVSFVVVVFDEGLDLTFQIAGQVVVLQQDAVFHGLVPALDFALCLGMERGTADVLHVLLIQPFG